MLQKQLTRKLQVYLIPWLKQQIYQEKYTQFSETIPETWKIQRTTIKHVTNNLALHSKEDIICIIYEHN